MIKLTAICIISAVFSLVIKKVNPELSLLLGVCAGILCVYFSLTLYQLVFQEVKHWQSMTLIQFEYFVPLIKCLGISLLSQLGVSVCKDAGQTVIATALDLCSNLASMICMIPLINLLFTLFENML